MRSNRAHAVPLRLIDGGLVNIHRDETVRRMAADLLKANAFHSKPAAVNCLLSLRYPTLEVALWMPDARALAFQTIVAREMSKP